MNQVFMNILTNATEAIDGDGEITIRCSRDDQVVSIQIADTGGGIILNGYASDMFISNNRVINNSGQYGGGIRVGSINDGGDAPLGQLPTGGPVDPAVVGGDSGAGGNDRGRLPVDDPDQPGSHGAARCRTFPETGSGTTGCIMALPGSTGIKFTGCPSDQEP